MQVQIICLIVVVCFAAIHLLEMTAFIARYAGISSQNRAFGFALNRSVMMLTRFFTMLLMPLLGYIVDIRIPKETFLCLIHGSLLGATIFSVAVYLDQNRWKHIFKDIIKCYKQGGGLLKSIVSSPFIYLLSFKLKLKRRKNYPIIKSIFLDKTSKNIFYLSIVVYTIYSLSVFLAFYMALYYYDYRSTIGQLSAITNAFATVLLTFFIEPKMAQRMDNSVYLSFRDNNSIMLGRILGVGVLSHVVILIFWLAI